MKIEHAALNVDDALSVSRWYVEHLGLTVKRRQMAEPWAHFLADDSGSVMLEIYANKAIPVPDYAGTDVMCFHIAYVSDDVNADTVRLKLAGATIAAEPREMANGDSMAILRDPWGIPVQLVKRSEPMI